jgi:hypothetical protein
MHFDDNLAELLMFKVDFANKKGNAGATCEIAGGAF